MSKLIDLTTDGDGGVSSVPFPPSDPIQTPGGEPVLEDTDV